MSTLSILRLTLVLLHLIHYVQCALKPITGPVKVGKLTMNPIGGGTWAWGNQFLWQYSKDQDVELKEAFDYAASKGVNWFDTADSYGTGELTGRSETLLGEFSLTIKDKNKQPLFCTKLAPFPFRIGEKAMLNTFDGCQARMQRSDVTNPVDMIQLHWPPTYGWQESNYLDAFESIVSKQKGAVQIGMSNFGPKGLRRIDTAVKSRGAGNNRVYTNQVQFSLLSRGPLENGLTDTCEELGIQPIGYSPLALGLLADKYTMDALPAGARGILFREYLPAIEPLLAVLRDIARSRRKTVSQVALNWNLQKGFLVLVGFRTVNQIKENLGAVGWALSRAEMEEIDKAAKKIKKTLIQNPNQCD